jgi:hypothetical protein
VKERYFACLDCVEHITTGYRWGYWTLEQPGIVRIGQPVDMDAVMGAEEYWQSDAAPLQDLLPSIRRFLLFHQDHDLIFGEVENFMDWDNRESPRYFIQWMDVLNTSAERFAPRDFVHRLGFRDWSEVLEYVKTPENVPYWWDSWPDEATSPIAVAKATFESLVADLKE